MQPTHGKCINKPQCINSSFNAFSQEYIALGAAAAYVVKSLIWESEAQMSFG